MAILFFSVSGLLAINPMSHQFTSPTMLGLMKSDIAESSIVEVSGIEKKVYICAELPLLVTGSDFTFSPISVLGKLSFDGFSLLFSKNAYLIEETGGAQIGIDHYSLKYSGNDSGFTYIAGVDFNRSVHDVLNASGTGFGFVLSLMKKMDTLLFGITYQSGSDLVWKNYKDVILYNSLPPVFSIGISQELSSKSVLFVKSEYLFPLVRKVDGGSKSVMIHKDEVDAMGGVRIKWNVSEFDFSNDLGIVLLPDSKVGSAASGPLVLMVGTGVAVTYESISASVAYGMDTGNTMKFFKFSLGYGF